MRVDRPPRHARSAAASARRPRRRPRRGCVRGLARVDLQRPAAPGAGPARGGRLAPARAPAGTHGGPRLSTLIPRVFAGPSPAALSFLGCARPRRRSGASRHSCHRTAAHARSAGRAGHPRHGGAARRRHHPDRHARRRFHRRADRQPAGRVRTARRRSWAVDHRRPSQGPARSGAGRSVRARSNRACSCSSNRTRPVRRTEIVYAATSATSRMRSPRIRSSRSSPTASIRCSTPATSTRRRSSPSPARSWSSAASCRADPPRTRARPRMRHRPGRRFLEPEIDRAVYDFAGVFEPETIAAVEETIDRIEERTKAEVVVYTQVVDSAHDRGDRAPRAGAHQPVGRRPQGLRRRPRDLLRLRAGSLERAGPALRGAGVRGHVPDQQRTPADLRERHAPAPPRGRLGRGDPRRDGPHRRGGDAGERRAARAGPAAQRRRWADRCAAGPRGSGWLGVLPLAALRQGPGLPRLAVDLRPGPAARPHRRIGRDGHGRRLVASRADDGDARPREPRADRLPRRVRAARARQEGRRRARSGRRRIPSSRRSASGTAGVRSARRSSSRSGG